MKKNIFPEDSAQGSSQISSKWRDRVSMLNMQMAKAICTDARLTSLEPDALGVLVRIHAMHRLGRGVPTDVQVAARLLGTTKRKLDPALASLLSIVPDLLIANDGYYMVPSLCADSVTVATNRDTYQRNSALIRWKRMREQVDGSSPLVEAPKTKVSLKAAKLKKTLSGGVTSPAEFLSENLDKDALPESIVIQGILQLSNDNFPVPDSRSVDCPHQKIADAFNTICKGLSKLNPTKMWTPARKVAIGNRWKENPDLQFWTEAVFARVQRSDYLTGRQANILWQCSFDWIIKPANLQKILEGNYDNRGAARRGLWDQGDKARDSEVLINMNSEIDNSAPFMRERTSALTVEGERGEENRRGIAPTAMDVASRPLHAPAQPLNATQRQLVVPGTPPAGHAPVGFGIRQPVQSRPVPSCAPPATPDKPGTLVVPPVNPINLLLKVPAANAAKPASKFTPDQLRASLLVRSASIKVETATPPAAGPAAIADAKTFSFRQ